MSNDVSVSDQQVLEEDCNVKCMNNRTTGIWEEHMGKHYFWSSEKMNWTDAEMACR